MPKSEATRHKFGIVEQLYPGTATANIATSGYVVGTTVYVTTHHKLHSAVPRQQHREGWIEKSKKLFESLKKLQDGWDTYRATPPSDVARVFAGVFLENLIQYNVQPYRIAPSVIGGIGFTFLGQRNNGREAYIEFLNDGQCFAVYITRAVEPVHDKVETYPIETNTPDYSDLIKAITSHTV